MSITDFQVLSHLGDGAYSSVLKVKRISDGKIYALKQVKMSNLKQKQRQNALNQVRLLASISSDHIIKYKQSFFDEKSLTLCLIIQFAQNGDLQKILSQRKSQLQWIPQKQIWKLAKHIALGLNTLHSKNIIHRDLKCANIFITNGIYKIADLNVSKLLKNSLAYTQTGTPYYASPEVWQDKPYQLKSDIWSLGCILYEACSLRPPFTSTSMDGLYKKIIKGAYPRLPSIYSQKLQLFISKCLQVNPIKRPSTKDIIHSLSVSQQQQQSNNVNKTNINLLSTIKLPKDMKSWRFDLPKSNYENENNQSLLDLDMLRKRQSQFQIIRQQKLQKIIKAKQIQRETLKKREKTQHYSNPQLQIPYQSIRQIRQKTYTQHNEPNYKSNIKIILPKIKANSQVDDYQLKREHRVGEILQRIKLNQRKKYSHHRPEWWG